MFYKKIVENMKLIKDIKFQVFYYININIIFNYNKIIKIRR